MKFKRIKFLEIFQKFHSENANNIKLRIFENWKVQLMKKTKFIENYLAYKSQTIQKKIFLEWRILNYITNERNQKYFQLFQYKSMKTKFNYFKNWYIALIKSQKISKYYKKKEKLIKYNFFNIWKQFTEEKKKLFYFQNQRKIQIYYNSMLAIKTNFIFEKNKKAVYEEFVSICTFFI